MQVVFYLALVAMALLWVTLWRFEITAKHVAARCDASADARDQAEESASGAAPHRR